MNDNKLPKKGQRIRYSVNLITQGNHKFFSLTMPSDILANTCFVTSRDEDPKVGFQRILDRQRCEDIANYVDNGFGTIPSSIILSAQPEANFKRIVKGIEFTYHPKAFLILDGQHRVYGYSLAKKVLRVPVVIYNGLSREEESRLFIDINTKQKSVSNELLLDIKNLAACENDNESFMRELFDKFNNDSNSVLLGMLSPASKKRNKITRVTFNSGIRIIMSIFSERDISKAFEALNSYFGAIIELMDKTEGLTRLIIVNPTVFKAFISLFHDVIIRVSSTHDQNFPTQAFENAILPLFEKRKISLMTKPGRSYAILHNKFSKILKDSFSL
jgi:DGQHR domain-containing protein